MASGDRYVLTLRGHNTIDSGQNQSVFAYEQTGGTGDASELNAEWIAYLSVDIVTPMAPIYVMDDVFTINLDDETDFDTTSIGLTGGGSGGGLPIWDAYTFMYVRASRAVQNGRKALGIVPEAAQSNGILESGTQTQMDALAVKLGTSLADAPTASTWVPRIWRRPGTYSSGVVSAPGLFYPIKEVISTGLSTQSTRKPGRGS